MTDILFYRLVVLYGDDINTNEFAYAELADALRMMAAFVEDPECRLADIWEKHRDTPSFRYIRGAVEV